MAEWLHKYLIISWFILSGTFFLKNKAQFYIADNISLHHNPWGFCCDSPDKLHMASSPTTDIRNNIESLGWYGPDSRITCILNLLQNYLCSRSQRKLAALLSQLMDQRSVNYAVPLIQNAVILCLFIWLTYPTCPRPRDPKNITSMAGPCISIGLVHFPFSGEHMSFQCPKCICNFFLFWSN